MTLSFPKTGCTLAALTAAALLAPSAAHASTKPMIVMVHRNINNVQDEANWSVLARNLSVDGFQVVSVGLALDESATAGKSTIKHVLDVNAAGRSVLLVGTSAVSESVSLAAQDAPTQIEGELFISAADAFASFGPRTVAVPASVASEIPTYQIRITRNKHSAQGVEDGATTFKVREEGRTTLPNLYDLEAAIETISAHKAHTIAKA